MSQASASALVADPDHCDDVPFCEGAVEVVQCENLSSYTRFVLIRIKGVRRSLSQMTLD